MENYNSMERALNPKKNRTVIIKDGATIIYTFENDPKLLIKGKLLVHIFDSERMVDWAKARKYTEELGLEVKAYEIANRLINQNLKLIEKKGITSFYRGDQKVTNVYL